MDAEKRIALLFIAGLVISNLFVANSTNPLWNTPESLSFWEAIQHHPGNAFTLWLSGWVNLVGADIFWIRASNAVLLLFAGGLFFKITQPLFGTRSLALQGLVLMASLVFPFLLKFSTADWFLMATHGLAWGLLLRYQRQPQWYFALAAQSAMAIASSVYWWGTTLLFASLYLGWIWQFKTTRNQWLLAPWGVLAALPLVLATQSSVFIAPEHLWLAWGRGILKASWVWSILGCLPWLGFLLAGLADQWSRARRKEPLATHHLIWLLAALASGTATIQWALAIIIAKQIDVFTRDQYPFKGVLRAGQILHLLTLMAVIFIVLVQGVSSSSDQIVLGLTFLALVYWIGTMVSIFGTFGNNKRMAIGALVALTMLSTYVYWLWVAPQWDKHSTAYHHVQQLTKTAGATSKSQNIVVLVPELFQQPDMKVYGLLNFQSLTDQVPSGTMNTLLITPIQTDTARWLQQGWIKSPNQVKTNVESRKTIIWMPANR